MAGMVVHSQAVQTSLQIVLPFGSVVHSYFIAVHLQMSMVGRLMPAVSGRLVEDDQFGGDLEDEGAGVDRQRFVTAWSAGLWCAPSARWSTCRPCSSDFLALVGPGSVLLINSLGVGLWPSPGCRGSGSGSPGPACRWRIGRRETGVQTCESCECWV